MPSAYSNLPQELWDEITAYLLPSSALSAVDAFKVKPSAYDKVWTTVFRSEDWLESDSATDANIVLIGADLDILSGITIDRARPRLVLAAYDRRGDLQYEDDILRSSLRGSSLGLEEHQFELTLAMSRLDVPEVFGKDFRYLFSYGEQGIQTKYCYWKDPKKKIRTLHSQDIQGIDGSITQTKSLAPIFLLNLNSPTELSSSIRSGPVQFIFRCFGGPSFWTGCPPLVDVILDENWEQNQQEYTFKGFTFKDKKYQKYHRQDTNWIGVAEVETRQNCAVIETS